MLIFSIIFLLIIASVYISRNISANVLFEVSGVDQGVVLGAFEKVKEDLKIKKPAPEILNPGFPDDEYVLAAPWKKKETSGISFPVSAAAAMDDNSKIIIFSHESEKELSIASLTKLVTALVFLDHNPGWEYEYTIRPDDRVEGGRVYLHSGEVIKSKDLFYLSLVGSANTATRALVHSTGMTSEEFVQKMNEKAQALGLKKTKFVDPIGMSGRNISTAKEVATIANIALDKEEISQATLTGKYEFTTQAGKRKTVYNTDKLLEIFPQNGINILGGKTGFTISSGYLFVAKFVNEDNNEIISVILGGQTPDSRFKYAKELAEWVYSSYIW